ncbi:MAG: site-specific integrase [Egibacteraceae bacterium]
MTVRQIHLILRAALGLAVKWGWIPTNPAEQATVPRYLRQDVTPPTPAEVERFLEVAWEQDPDLGTLLWLAMVTGARRGELCGLRWSHVRPGDGFLLISRNFVHRGSQVREKDTKTRQARRVALDDGAEPLLPDSVTGRLNRLSKRLGVKVNLRSLRHYAATEMLTNGVDLRAAQVLAKSVPRPPRSRMGRA